MRQFLWKFAILIIIFNNICYSSERFLIANEIHTGEKSQSIESILDNVDQPDQEFLRGVSDISYSIDNIKNDWLFINDRSKCSDDQFYKSYSYIKYLFYLLRVTLNYEILLDYVTELNNIGISICQINFTELLNQCQPKSDEMKKFVKRSKGYLAGHGNVGFYNFSNKSNYSKLPKGSDIDGPFALTVKSVCPSENFCDNKIKSSFIKECDVRKEQFLLACSEEEAHKDKLFSREMLNLVKRSVAIEYIRKFNAKNDCADVFFNRYINKHLGDDEMIRAVMRKTVKSSIPYLQGRLFVAGSLKEFDELGVGNQLFQEIKSSKEELKLPKVQEVKKIIKSSPKVVKNIIEKIEKDKPNVIKELPKRKSALQKASLELVDLKKSSVALDMDLFKDDFIFSNKALTRLHEPLAMFQKRSSLQEMKQYDDLGQKKSPMRLLFLKYLIDNGYHQGLYNIQSVLGNHFYVKNDLDSNDEKLYKMSINNDENTNYMWQIYLLKEE